MKCYNLSYFCVACIVEATHGYLYSLSVHLRLLIFTPCFMRVNKDLEEEFEDAKGIIRIRKSKKDKQRQKGNIIGDTHQICYVKEYPSGAPEFTFGF